MKLLYASLNIYLICDTQMLFRILYTGQFLAQTVMRASAVTNPSPPSGLRSFNVTEQSMGLAWNLEGAADWVSIQMQHTNQQGHPRNKRVAVNATYIIMERLVPGKRKIGWCVSYSEKNKSKS